MQTELFKHEKNGFNDSQSTFLGNNPSFRKEIELYSNLNYDGKDQKSLNGTKVNGFSSLTPPEGTAKDGDKKTTDSLDVPRQDSALDKKKENKVEKEGLYAKV